MKKNIDKIKTWFVTGASSGVGHEVCRQLIAQGYNVIAVSRRIPDFLGDNVLTLSVDVSNQESIKKAIDLGVEKFGRIDVLMNNAGISSYTTLEEISLKDMSRVMEVNFWGAVNTIKAILPHFRENAHGLIINNTSQSGLSPRSYGTAYCSSKYALEGLTSALWLETKNFCHVMAVELGFFSGTEINKNYPKRMTSIPEYENIPPFYKKYSRNFTNNLEKAVSFLLQTVQKKKLPRRLILGQDALFQIQSEINWIKKDLKSSQCIAKKCTSFPFIKFCGITLFRKKIKDNITKYYILGIPIKISK